MMSEHIYIRKKAGTVIETATANIIVVIAGAIMVFPFLWMAVSALKTSEEMMHLSSFWPASPQYGNFISILFGSPVPRYLFNSLFVSVCVVILQVATCSLFAYGITFLDCRLKECLYRLVLFTYMVPTAATYIPCYILLARMGLLDSYQGLILSNGVSVFGIFLLRQAFRQLPGNATEAARIDGAGHLTILMRIIFPMTRSSFLTFILLSFIGTYNSYMWPSLITDTPELSLVSQGLRRFLYEGGAYGTRWPLVMAAGTIVVLPLLLLFAATWKWIVQGITDFGSKG